MIVDDDDSALSENDTDCSEINPGGETGPSEIADESVHGERIHETADQETEQAAFEEVNCPWRAGDVKCFYRH